MGLLPTWLTLLFFFKFKPVTYTKQLFKIYFYMVLGSRIIVKESSDRDTLPLTKILLYKIVLWKNSALSTNSKVLTKVTLCVGFMHRIVSL